ncbi:uracil-DNA glycosylase [bacterium]|nr:uracil-DNA glycosylase [bacterium]
MARQPLDPARNQLRILKDMGFGFLEEVDLATEEPEPVDERQPAVPGPFSDNLVPSDWQAHEPLSLEERVEALDSLAREEVATCEKCRLCHSRNNVVPGEGNPMAELMFIGEGPGAEEDRQGRPFVGAAGDLLTKIIGAMQFTREEVWIGNVVKCRPPQNRQPEADEMAACLPYLRRQLEIVRPKVIVTLGKTALMGLLPQHNRVGITKMRGKWLEYEGIPLMPTFHPAYLLRSPNQKKYVWEDMQEVMKVFGKTVEKK